MNFFNFHLIGYISYLVPALSYVVQFFDLTGANKSIYSPEPLDVGRILQADIMSNSQRIMTVTTIGPIEIGWC